MSDRDVVGDPRQAGKPSRRRLPTPGRAQGPALQAWILCACWCVVAVDFCGGKHAMSDRDVQGFSAKDFRAFRAFRGQ